MLDVEKSIMFRNFNSSPEAYDFCCPHCDEPHQLFTISATVWCSVCKNTMPAVPLIARNVLKRLEYHIDEESKKTAKALIITPAEFKRTPSVQNSIVSFLRGDYLEKNV